MIEVGQKQVGNPNFPRFIIERRGAARRRQYWSWDHWTTNRAKATVFTNPNSTEVLEIVEAFSET